MIENKRKRGAVFWQFTLYYLFAGADYSAKTENIHGHFMRMGEEVLILSQK